MWPLLTRWSERLDWRSTGDRLGSCRVGMGAAEAEKLRLTATVEPFMNLVLEELFGVFVDGRVPVIAIGSNAAPAQLRRKFADHPASLLIPSVRARMANARVGFCSFIAPRGYVPATLYPETGAMAEVVVQLLDPAQMETIDRTEGQLYRRVWLSADEFPILLETGESLPGAYAYVAEHGYLVGEDGPLVMGLPGEERPDDLTSARWLPDQRALLAELTAGSAFRERCGATADAVFAGETDPMVALSALTDDGRVRSDNPLALLPEERGAIPRRYGDDFSRVEPRSDGDAVIASVGRTSDFLRRKGRSVVRLGANLDRMLGYPHHVEIASQRLCENLGEQAPRAVATVYRDERDGAPEVSHPGVIEVDQMLRFGAGVQVGEPLRVRAAFIGRSRGFDPIIGAPNYLTLRVTLADSSMAEREVCLMSPLSLQLLGVQSGDYVVLEGGADAEGRVASVAVKAFELPADTAEERRYYSRGTWGSRFPGAYETLGISPDIPLLFIDASTRARLQLGKQQLAVARARPARVQQFGNELREMLVVLAVALIGVFGILPSPVLGSVLLSVLILLTVVLVVLKLRRRLSHGSQRIRSRARR